MRPLLVFFGIVIVFSFAGQTAMACTCAGAGTPCESYGRAAAVFVGTVTGVRANEPKTRDLSERRKLEDSGEIDLAPIGYKFSVEQAYLGVAGAEIEIFTGRGGGDCGITFQTGQRYLVYAYSSRDKLTTNICTRTKPFNRASEDVAFLGTLSSAAPGVTIYGGVSYHPDGEPKGSDIKSKPLSPEVLITIESELEKREIRPDPEGGFRITGLRPGRYKVALRLPETLTTTRNEQVLTLADRGCAAVGWHVVDNGRVNGRVLNADGEPVPGILVSLVDPGASPKDYPSKLERTNDEGYFSFSAVPRGTYHIAVNHNRHPNPTDPTNAYPPSFYPGVVDQRHAQAITVGSGEKLSDIEIRIPSKRPASTLIGSVVWEDGSPVANAELIVRDDTNTGNSFNHAIATDEQGKFKIEGYTGQKLVIQARSNRPYVAGANRSERMERTSPLTIRLERPTQTVKIVITKLR